MKYFLFLLILFPLTSQAAVQALPPGNITKQLQQATGNVYLDDGIYTFDPSVTFRNSNVHVIGKGRTTIIQFAVAQGASSGMVMYGSNWCWEHLDFSGKGVIRIYAPNNTYLDVQMHGSLSNIDQENNANDQTYVWCNFGTSLNDPPQANAIYNTANHTAVLHCNFFGSMGEPVFRNDMNPALQKPKDTITAFNEYWNNCPQKKEAYTDREADGSFHIADIYHAWTSHGQKDTNPGVHATEEIYRSCVWDTLRPGGALVDLRHDTSALFDHCIFPASQTDAAVDTNPRVRVFKSNNQVVVHQVGYKPLVQPSESASIIDLGSGEQVIPTTQPSNP